jgi:hypothetical protein
VSGCFACQVDHHHDCPSISEEDCSIDADTDGWYAVYCCCGLAVDRRQTQEAEYGDYAEELRRRGWSQPPDPSQHPGRSGR